MNRTGWRAPAAACWVAAAMSIVACSGESDGVSSYAAPDFPGIAYSIWRGDLPRPGETGGPVWLIALDGATWKLIDPMIDRGELPHLRSLVEGGTRAVLLSEEPTLSPALWATVATGVPRQAHGVVNFTEKVAGSYDEVEVGPPDRLAPAVWDLVSAAGGRSWVVSWFGSYPAEPISGVYLSKGLDPAAPGPGQVEPPGLASALRTARPARVPQPFAAGIARTEFLEKTVTEDARTMALLERLCRDDTADFVAIYISGIDVVQHVTWKHMDPSYEPFPGEGPAMRALADVIPSYYRYADDLLGRMVELAPAGTTFFIVSDHGAGPMEPERAFHFQLDVLLQMLGYTRMQEGDVEKIDGARTTAFAISELYRDTKRIWLNLQGVESEGVVPPEAASTVARDIATRLSALRTDTAEPLFDRVEVRVGDDGWVPGQHAIEVRFSRAALLARSFLDGDRELDMSPVRLRHRDVSGGHRLEGVLIANGPAVRRARLERPATLYNVAPTLLYLLGLPQDERMLQHAPRDGGVLESALRPEVLAARPVAMARTYPGAVWSARGAGRPVAGEDPASEENLERLRALGYLR